MSEKKDDMVQFDLDPGQPGSLSAQTEARLDAIKERDIDYSDIPELSEECFKLAAQRGAPDWANRRAVNIWIDKDVLAYFQALGDASGDLMNEVLRAYVERRRVDAGSTTVAPVQ